MRSNGASVGRSTVPTLVLLITVVACSSGGSSARAPSTPSSETRLADTGWVLADPTTLVPGATDVSVSARFAHGSVSGDGGCNTYRAAYTTSGSKLSIGPDVASTLIACGPIPTAVEREYLARLTRIARYSISGSTLTLAGDDGDVLLTFHALGGASTLAGMWNATSYYTGTAVQSVATASTLTAVFSADQVTGNGGCNTFSGPVSLRGDGITIGPLRSTLAACANPELTTQEQHYLAALELARTYSVTDSRLDLFRADGGFAVTFERAGEGDTVHQ